MEGRRLLAQGREAEVFLQADGTILKLMREPSYAERVEREVAALTALAAAGITAPPVHGTAVVEGRPGLVVGRIEGDDLLTRLGHRPLRVMSAGRALGLAHAAMHEVEAPAQLPDLNEDLRERIAMASLLPDDLRSAALDVLGQLPRGDRLCHGDFHLGNVMGSWSAPAAIDWGDASRGDPVADVARTELLQRMGDTPPGAPALLRVLAPVGRDLVAARYLSTYRRRRPIDLERLEQWKIVRAAARLIEPVPSEHPKLIAFLRRRLSR